MTNIKIKFNKSTWRPLFISTLIITISIGFLIPSVYGNGMMIPTTYQDVLLPEQKAAISWDGTHETLLHSTRFSTNNITDMVWIIPISSKTVPELAEGDIKIFYELAKLFYQEDEKEQGGLGLSSNFDSGSTIEVISTKKSYIYDLTTLRANNATDLLNWLEAHNFITTSLSNEALDNYCSDPTCYFITNKVNL